MDQWNSLLNQTNAMQSRSGPGCMPLSSRTIFHLPDRDDGLMTHWMTVLLLMLALVTILMNLGVVVRVYRLYKKRYHFKPAFCFIGNLAFSDFMVGVYVVIAFCIDLAEYSKDWKDKCCALLTAISVTACQETIFTIVLISVDKYIYICHGLTYPTIMTKNTAWLLLAASWFLSFLIGFSPAMGLRERDWCSCNFQNYVSKEFAVVLFITAVFIPVVVIVWLYSIILSLAIALTKRNLRTKESCRSTNTTSTTYLSTSSQHSTLATKKNIELGSDNNGRECETDEIITQTTCLRIPTLEIVQDISPSTKHTPLLQPQTHQTLSHHSDGNSSHSDCPEAVDGNTQVYLEAPSTPVPHPSTTDSDDLDQSSRGLRNYYRKLISAAKSKIDFMQQVRATKMVFLIIFCFVITYGPFVIGTLVYKCQEQPSSSLFHVLNNLLYFVVVANSLINPLIYAYGYQEFRVRTQKFKGIFARERTPKY